MITYKEFEIINTMLKGSIGAADIYREAEEQGFCI